jgi:hypothetical protein
VSEQHSKRRLITQEIIGAKRAKLHEKEDRLRLLPLRHLGYISQMDFGNSHHIALKSALALLLRPLFRVLLRHAVSFGAFEDIAKRIYVNVALEEFGMPGKKASISRVSILSGLTRKEVQRLASEPAQTSVDSVDSYNRAARVLTGWMRDPDFTDERGAPLVLEAEGALGFAGLVKRFSGDMPARAVLDELVRVGSVSQRPDGRCEMVTRAYVPQHSAIDKIGILGTDVADLIDSIDHNLRFGETDPRFQRKVMYDSIPLEALPTFRKLSGTQAQALLEKLDRWLAEHDIENEHGNTAPRARVGLGIYYFEERLEQRLE